VVESGLICVRKSVAVEKCCYCSGFLTLIFLGTASDTCYGM
jgi:hypothetical protein